MAKIARRLHFGLCLLLLTTSSLDIAYAADSANVAATAPASIDAERLVNAASEPGNWLTHGGNYAETRETALTAITPANVKDLGLAWYFDTGTRRGLEASPLVFDGVIYTTGSWSKVFANNAVSGEPLWSFDPQVPMSWGANACCDVVNRGVAAWGNSVFVGTLDGRLIALDNKTGEVQWETLTIDPSKPYTITGAPRAVNGKILIGNGGAEYGVRGYLSAYAADTGELVWRFYTVPGNPAKPAESDAMTMAAATWSGDVYWQMGGGGTVWDSMAYDPALNLLYFGVGNGSPWNRHIRSPGGGDNLFLSSIVAVNADTGAYVWHYQTTPGDTWDYTATQHIILADLVIDNKTRKVLMQAPKNSFFYVLDRVTGELLSAEKYTPSNWASHVDMATGRPVETETADHLTEVQITGPAPTGGHNWQPMAYNAGTGLVYIPAMESIAPYSTAEDFAFRPGHHWNMGQLQADEAVAMTTSLSPTLMAALIRRLMKGKLVAWDPVTQTEKWRVNHTTMWNGGVLTTTSGLVFQGSGDGHLAAYNAASGEQLWQTNTVTGVIAPPISYAIDGVQYVAVMAGWGGAGGLIVNLPGSASAGNGRLLVYALNAKQSLPPASAKMAMPEPPPAQGTETSIAHGAALYANNCLRCHSPALNSDGVVADLRYLSPASHQAFNDIVLGGVLSGIGMVSFADTLSVEDSEAIHDYVIHTARLKWDEDHAPQWWQDLRGGFYDVLAGAIAWFVAP